MLIADRYEIDDLPLGRGGMGAVHQGRDLRLDRRVAVKLLRLPGSDDEVQHRFAREARIVARLEHPGVPVLYDFGTYDQRLFQVMQFVDGVTVADLVHEFGPLPEAWAANIAAQTAAVLTEAHENGICHRDLKPTNLMLCPDGAVKVLDFGLALLKESDVAPFSRAGQILGTPSYMAPEQIQRGTAEPRSDLYALGCVLHEMLTGDQLFTGPTAYAVFDKHVKEAPRRLRSALDPVVQRLLAKDPEDRPATALDVFVDLQRFAQDPPPLPGFVQHPSAAAAQDPPPQPGFAQHPSIAAAQDVASGFTQRPSAVAAQEAAPGSAQRASAAAAQDAARGFAQHPSTAGAQNPGPGVAQHPSTAAAQNPGPGVAQRPSAAPAQDPAPGFAQWPSTAAMYASLQLRPGSGSPRDHRSPTGAAPHTHATAATPPSA